MVTAQELLSLQTNTLQKIQRILSLGSAAAASHALKSDIQKQVIQLDQLETQFQILAMQRGWELPELEPITRWLLGCRFHARNDPSIAEYILRQYTDDTIYLMKHFNKWAKDDDAIRRLFQKQMDCCVLGVRQMQPYL